MPRKRKGGLTITINEDGKTRIQIVNNEEAGHSEMLVPFQESLSDGDKKRVHAHTHDHSHGHSHVHDHKH